MRKRAPLVAIPSVVACVSLPAAMTNRVLVQVDCATHGFMAERAHGTVKAALIEWITASTFDGEPAGRFAVSQTGVVNRTR